MAIRYSNQSFHPQFTSNNHQLTVTVPAGLSNSVMLITKDCNDVLPWSTFTTLTVGGSTTGVVPVGGSGDNLAGVSVRAWLLINPPAGTYVVSANFNTSSQNGGVLAVDVFDDVDTAAAVSDFKTFSGGSVSSPISAPALVTPSGGMAFFAARAMSGSSLAATAGTLIDSRNESARAYLLNGATVGFSWSGTNPTQASAIAIALKPAAGGATAPTLTGSITVSALGSTSYTLSWPAGTDAVAVTGYEVSLDGGTTYTPVGNVLTVNVTGRTPSTTDQVRVRAFNAAGLRSTPPLSTSVTLSPPATYSITSAPMENNTRTGVLASVPVVYTWTPAGRTGSMGGKTPLDGSGTTAGDGRLTVSGLAAPGAGRLDVSVLGAAPDQDQVFCQYLTAA